MHTGSTLRPLCCTNCFRDKIRGTLPPESGAPHFKAKEKLVDELCSNKILAFLTTKNVAKYVLYSAHC